MKKYIYLPLILILNSCFCTYDITINNDGSAHIEINDWESHDGEQYEQSVGGEDFYSEYDAFKNSEVVSNYERIEENGFYKVTYDINNVDSLENYLFPLNSMESGTAPTSFKYENEQFIITHVFEEDGPNDATMYGEFIPLRVIFRFKKDIVSFSSELDFVKQINKRELEINTDLNTISYGKGTKKVIVSF